jgi:site-specific DNA-methyltransferase (adenine-specific)
MTAPYYSDDRVTLYHGDCREVLASMADRSVDCVITDPPYTERTHGMAKTNKGKGHGVKAITFAAITDADLQEALSSCGRVTRRWVVANLDYAHAVAFDHEPPPGLRVLRLGVWVKTNPMPQISADRPAQGWESIAYMHRADEKPVWHGGGRHGNFILPTQQGEEHPTAKPLPMVRQWVQWFTNPGDVIFDGYAGSGTTGRAALDEGRRCILVEQNEADCERIVKRLAQDVLDFGDAS